ncbi:MAG: segregation/condensation protein A, partial [Opitutales bacterium]|nr:segregation/condensation protein A [Opitutales bacterium]
MEEFAPEDGILGSAGEMLVKLPVFEGPLDLLLFLIRKNEIDIYDIPIEQITKQYLAVLRAMKNLSLDIAGEFFVMAATLMYIKSRMLLPTDERAKQAQDEEDGDIDPRWELVEQLLEYKKVKQGAMLLEDMIDARQNCLPRICKQKDAAELSRPLKNSDRIEIWNTFNNVLRR